MTTPLCIGVDSQPTRIGIALVTNTIPPVPVWADAFTLVRPDMTIGRATRVAFRKPQAVAEAMGADVVLAGMERAIVYGKNTSLETVWDSGGTYALAVDAVERRFGLRRNRVIDLRVSEWKAKALGKGHGNASKAEVAVWARALARAHGWSDVQLNGLATHDATDALGIAVGGVMKDGGS